MPRLPTILVIGSQAISTRFSPAVPSAEGIGIVEVIALPLCLASLPGPLGAGQQIITGLAPTGFLVQRVFRDVPQCPDGLAVRHDRRGCPFAAGRFVHERHEFVREARHCAADADAAYVGAAANTVHPAAFGHVALDHRSPAAELDDALWGPVFGGEVALFVVPRA